MRLLGLREPLRCAPASTGPRSSTGSRASWRWKSRSGSSWPLIPGRRASCTAARARPRRPRPTAWPRSGFAAVAYHAGLEDAAPALAAGGLRARRGGGGGGHHRLRHGHRQVQRALGGARGPAAQPGGLLPGDRARRPRRGAGRHRPLLRARGHRRAALAHRAHREPAGARARRGPPAARCWPSRNPRCAGAGSSWPTSAKRTAGNCGRCDVCAGEVALEDATEEARKLLSAAVRTGERFGAHHLADIVTGTSTDKVLERGHQRLPTFGAGADRPRPFWLSLAQDLAAAGFLARGEERTSGLPPDRARPAPAGRQGELPGRPPPRARSARRPQGARTAGRRPGGGGRGAGPRPRRPDGGRRGAVPVPEAPASAPGRGPRPSALRGVQRQDPAGHRRRAAGHPRRLPGLPRRGGAEAGSLRRRVPARRARATCPTAAARRTEARNLTERALPP